jgi:hypothetical protein
VTSSIFQGLPRLLLLPFFLPTIPLFLKMQIPRSRNKENSCLPTKVVFPLAKRHTYPICSLRSFLTYSTTYKEYRSKNKNKAMEKASLSTTATVQETIPARLRRYFFSPITTNKPDRETYHLDNKKSRCSPFIRRSRYVLYILCSTSSTFDRSSTQNLSFSDPSWRKNKKLLLFSTSTFPEKKGESSKKPFRRKPEW